MGAILAILIMVAIGFSIKPKSFTHSNSLSSIYNFGLFMRIIGTIGYIVYAYNFSDGSVDAWIYDNYATIYADYFRRFDFSPFTEETLWRGKEFFYTNFVAYPAAIFMILVLDNEFGVYLLFSTVCFVGLVLLFKSFQKNYFFLDQSGILLWFLFFPALWFWTSTIGKDAFMFLGVGVVCLGISNKSLNYVLILLGIAILYAFRPPTAYVTILALGSFFILNLKDSWLMRIFKIAIGLAVIVFLANYLSNEWGVEEFSNEELAELQSGTLKYNEFGSGVLDDKSGGITSIPSGIIDVLARPFLWEIRNVATAAASLEITALLILLFIKRKSIYEFISNCLVHRLSTFILAFVIIYAVTVGFFENNIGLIARHRAIIFPFLFVMAFSYDERVKRKYMLFKRNQHLYEREKISNKIK